ncbi:MAG: thioredoxin family protein [Saprospiraceae bacterium]|nr:thioredoxin family protein [Saprospiraceae bacterium]
MSKSNFKLLLSILTIVFGVPKSAHAGNIKFINSLEQAKKLAEQEQKVIFVDVMADWCGPCKKMIVDIESNSAMVDFFNSNFINLKINEKFNRNFLTKYSISAFPTLMFLSKSGEVIESRRGYPGSETLFKLAKSVYTNSDVYVNEIKMDASTFNEETFLNEVSVKVAHMNTDYKKQYLEKLFQKGEVFQKVILENFPTLIDFKMVSDSYKKSGYQGNLQLTEKLLLSFLFHNNNFFFIENIRKESKSLSELTQLQQNKIMAFMMAYRELVLYKQIGASEKENLLVYARSLLKIYPETTDLDLLHDAFVELIKYEKFPEFYLQIEPSILNLSEKSDEFLYSEILSVIYAKTGRKDEAALAVARGQNLAVQANVKHIPFMIKFREEIMQE